MIFNEQNKINVNFLGTIQGKEMYEVAKANPEVIVNLFNGNEPLREEQFDINREFFKVKLNKVSYYFFARANGVDVFKEIPLVERTELFNWKQKTWGTISGLWCQINKGLLRFNCTYYIESKNVRINVFWGNKSYDAIDVINVHNATNEDILEAIDSWMAKFERDVNRSANEEYVA